MAGDRYTVMITDGRLYDISNGIRWLAMRYTGKGADGRQ